PAESRRLRMGLGLLHQPHPSRGRGRIPPRLGPVSHSVLHVCAEVNPFAKTGGLAAVCSGLPRALARARLPLPRVMPRYRAVDPARHSLARRLTPLEVPLGAGRESVTLYEGRLPGGLVTVYLLDHPLYDRAGLYGEGGTDYPDNGRRFALLCRGALELAHHLDQWPKIVHGHDWQGSAALAYAKTGAVAGRPIPATVLTIHNLAFQGLAPKEAAAELGLGADLLTPETGELFDQLSLLKL